MRTVTLPGDNFPPQHEEPKDPLNHEVGVILNPQDMVARTYDAECYARACVNLTNVRSIIPYMNRTELKDLTKRTADLHRSMRTWLAIAIEEEKST